MTEMAPNRVPMNLWGKDHWSTFAYIETRIVDYKGVPNVEHLRVDADRHPAFVNSAARSYPDKKHPSILKGGTELPDHDDWDCIDDFIEVGLMEWNGTGVNPVFKLTPKGRRYATMLREYKSDGGVFSKFDPPTEIENVNITHTALTENGMEIGGTVG